jgi:tagatose-6-phosphate ketose/aldose isomerase
MMGKPLLNRTDEFFDAAGAGNTAREIAHQPDVWRKMAADIYSRRDEITEFMTRAMSVHGLRIIFSGAGSSAFLGESAQQLLFAESDKRVEAIHTTDIVATPECTLKDIPTLLVSYSRSGESPESVCALDYAAAKIQNLFNLVFVCKENSSVADRASKMPNTLVLYMPPEACDLGFAMTSSVSSMALGTWFAFGGDRMKEREKAILSLADNTETELDSLDDLAREICGWDFDRIAYLGSGELRGLGREGAVKMLELTAGRVNAVWDTPMSFRHGPKSVVNDNTVTVHLLSERPGTRRYDDGLLEEMIRQKKGNRIISVRSNSPRRTNGADVDVHYSVPEGIDPVMASYIKGLVFVQLLALEKSLSLGCKTDDPCSGGEINRVVQGVAIYPLYG